MGAGAAEQAFELQAGDDVGMSPVAIRVWVAVGLKKISAAAKSACKFFIIMQI